VEDREQARRPHTHVVVPIDDGERELRYADVRRFGAVVPFAGPAALDDERARLGPDPLSWSAEERALFVRRLKATKRSLKDALLDQGLVAGVGNIYACEALFMAGLSPLARAARVPLGALDELAGAVAEVLARAVQAKGTTFSDFVDGAGQEGGYFAQVLVFQREGEPCSRCGRLVERIVQGGRSTFLCRRCQPRRRRPGVGAARP
jgi:formamidopyrimidine-DNA glycosylase